MSPDNSKALSAHPINSSASVPLSSSKVVPQTHLMKAYASLKSFAMSPQKVNLVLQLVRRTSVVQALRVLKFCSKRKASASVRCLIQSALANGQNNYGLETDKWMVDEIYCTPARPIKSVIFHAKGKTGRCCSRRSHVFVSLKGEF